MAYVAMQQHPVQAHTSRTGYELNLLLCHQAQDSLLHSVSVTSTYLDYSRGMLSKVRQPLQLAQRCHRVGKGLEH